MAAGRGSQLEQVHNEVEEDSGYIRDADGSLIPDYDQTIKNFDEGDVVSGEVVRVDRDEILVDIGYKSEGAIPIRELSVRGKTANLPEVGDTIDALVLQKEDKEGRLILSKKRADYEKAWQRIVEIVKGDGRVKGQAIEVVKGGLIVDIGLRGFLPASLIDLKRVKDLDQFVGQELECKIIEHEKSRNNVVLSRKAILQEEKFQERQKVIASLTKGEKIKGKVSSIVDFGVFVDLGGIDGLVHISELSWTHVDHPSEVVSQGEEIEIQVLDIDFERQRVSLGLKQTLEDPWKEKVAKYSVGDVIEGKITKIAPFGTFVGLEDGVEALVHVSEFPEGKDTGDFQVAEELKAKIILLDQQKRRIGLSLRRVDEETPEEVAEPAVAEAKDDEEAAAPVVPKISGETVLARTAKGRRKAKKVMDKEQAADVEDETPVDMSVTEETEGADDHESESIDSSPEPEVVEDAGAASDEKKAEESEEVSAEGASLEDVLHDMKKSRGEKG